MDKQDFYNNYNEITKEALSSGKLPFLKESLEKIIAEMQNLFNSLRDTINFFFTSKTNALNNPVCQFSDDYKNILNSLIEKFKELEVLYAESKKIIAELEQNYTEKERDFLPALEKQIFKIAYDNFTNNIPIFTNYLANYKEWLEDTNNLPAEIKAKIKKENSAINTAKHNDIIKQRLLEARKIQQKKQNRK